MKHINLYKIFESKDLTDEYLSKMGTNKQEVIDVFQSIVDLGYEPEFKLLFINKNGGERDHKKITTRTSQETPLLSIRFEGERDTYVGRSKRFSNLEYLESLYHCLSMFMSMFKDKCNIKYDINNYIELEVRCKFETEYDDNKVSISEDELYDALNSCSSVPKDYEVEVSNDFRCIKLNAKPNNNVGQRLLDELKKSKTETYISNLEEVELIGANICRELADIFSKKFKKDITYNMWDGVHFSTGSKRDDGIYLDFYDKNKETQLLLKVEIGTNYQENRVYTANIKRGFLKIDKCDIELESLELRIEIID